MSNSKENIVISIKKEIEELSSKLNLFIKKSKNYSYLRLAIFISLVFFSLGLYFFDFKMFAGIVASIMSLAFLILMYTHTKIDASIKKLKIFKQIKKEELSRANLDWGNIPSLDKNLVSNSTYLEQDLNITENNGLLHLISTGISQSSINILRKWLSGKSISITEIITRQNIIRELKEIKDFRDNLLLTTKLSISNHLVKTDISEWIQSGSRKKGLKAYTVFLSILISINILMLIGFFANFFNVYYYQFLLIYIFFYFVGFKYIRDIHFVSEFLYDEVRKYSSIFGFIENYNFGSNNSLKNFLSPFLKAKSLPSKSLKKINSTVEVLNLRANPFIWFLLICIAPIDYFISIKVEKFKKSIKKDLPIWLNTWHNLEAYNSLAGFAYINPDYQFPLIKENTNLFEAKKIGHPLIKSKQKITNDFDISEATKTNIITGSNMSGKSTFLRTVGINTLLAYSGSVVDADYFVVPRFNIYTCIKVSDSVVDGISYFYAEVKRLKQIITDIKTDEIDSLVLIDEIYKGTNNVERVIGSKALIKYLSNENIYSIISTHDLELVKIADEIDKVKNFHFKELVNKNKMSFDYKLMNGPCPTTNALKIMESEGLPI